MGGSIFINPDRFLGQPKAIAIWLNLEAIALGFTEGEPKIGERFIKGFQAIGIRLPSLTKTRKH